MTTSIESSGGARANDGSRSFIGRDESAAEIEQAAIEELQKEFARHLNENPGSVVEMKALEPTQYYKASFLSVTHIISTPDGITLRGIALTRTRNLRGRLPRLRNEVAIILHVDKDDKRPEEVQAAVEVPVENVVKLRHCHWTNAISPQYRTVVGIHITISELEQNGVLMCRWRCIFKYRNAAVRDHYMSPPNKFKLAPAAPENVIEHLRAEHVSKGRFKVSETEKFNAWRGGKVRGGEYIPKQAEDNTAATASANISTNTSNSNKFHKLVVELDDGEAEPEQVLIEKKPGQRYTFGDMFCGAGGTSCGAQKAGFHVKLACDNDVGACRTYNTSFPEARLSQLDIFEFITQASTNARVDVLHLSPPCQFWSPAHTCAGVNDDANIAVLFSCQSLLTKLRPRIFTLEQTFGITHARFEYYFNALLHGFTSQGYSIRWRVVDLRGLGTPASRKRVIIIGSCPGEEGGLPTFPRNTHAAPGSKSVRLGVRKPYLTVRKMLARIPDADALRRRSYNGGHGYGNEYEDEMHRPYSLMRKNLPPWDDDVTLRRCITTSGGYGNYHPSGRREFTLRELATLQTFPVNYPFCGPMAKRQIGNAFPPLVVKALYTHIRRWLERADRVYAVENDPVDLDDPDVEIIDVDAEGEDKVMLDVDFDDDDEEEEEEEQEVLEEEEGDLMEIDQGLGLSCADVNQGRHVWPGIDLLFAGDEE